MHHPRSSERKNLKVDARQSVVGGRWLSWLR